MDTCVSKQELKERLAKIHFTEASDVIDASVTVFKHFRKASVLVPIFFKENIPFVLLTLRASKMSLSPSTVSFPGGGHDETSDASETDAALREAQEEIGLEPDQVEVLCHLPKSYVRPNYIVTPVVGIIPADFTPIINPEEVEFTFHLPLSRFCQKWDYMKSFPIFDYSYDVYYFTDVFGENKVTTWGFTAGICMLVAAAVYPNGFTQPDSDIVVIPPITAELWIEDITFYLKHCISHLMKSRL